MHIYPKHTGPVRPETTRTSQPADAADSDADSFGARQRARARTDRTRSRSPMPAARSPRETVVPTRRRSIRLASVAFASAC